MNNPVEDFARKAMATALLQAREYGIKIEELGPEVTLDNLFDKYGFNEALSASLSLLCGACEKPEVFALLGYDFEKDVAPFIQTGLDLAQKTKNDIATFIAAARP